MEILHPMTAFLYLFVWITPPFEDFLPKFLAFFMSSYHIFRIAILNEIIHVPSRVALLDGGVVN